MFETELRTVTAQELISQASALCDGDQSQRKEAGAFFISLQKAPRPLDSTAIDDQTMEELLNLTLKIDTRLLWVFGEFLRMQQVDVRILCFAAKQIEVNHAKQELNVFFRRVFLTRNHTAEFTNRKDRERVRRSKGHHPKWSNFEAYGDFSYILRTLLADVCTAAQDKYAAASIMSEIGLAEFAVDIVDYLLNDWQSSPPQILLTEANPTRISSEQISQLQDRFRQNVQSLRTKQHPFHESNQKELRAVSTLLLALSKADEHLDCFEEMQFLIDQSYDKRNPPNLEVLALCREQGQEVLELLLKYGSTEFHTPTRAAAARALGKYCQLALQDGRRDQFAVAVGRLNSLLCDNEVDVRSDSIMSAAHLGTDANLLQGNLMRILQDRQSSPRALAAFALGRTSTPADEPAVQALVQAAGDSNGAVEESAKAALKMLNLEALFEGQISQRKLLEEDPLSYIQDADKSVIKLALEIFAKTRFQAEYLDKNTDKISVLLSQLYDHELAMYAGLSIANFGARASTAADALILAIESNANGSCAQALGTIARDNDAIKARIPALFSNHSVCSYSDGRALDLIFERLSNEGITVLQQVFSKQTSPKGIMCACRILSFYCWQEHFGQPGPMPEVLRHFVPLLIDLLSHNAFDEYEEYVPGGNGCCDVVKSNPRVAMLEVLERYVLDQEPLYNAVVALSSDKSTIVREKAVAILNLNPSSDDIK